MMILVLGLGLSSEYSLMVVYGLVYSFVKRKSLTGRQKKNNNDSEDPTVLYSKEVSLKFDRLISE